MVRGPCVISSLSWKDGYMNSSPSKSKISLNMKAYWDNPKILEQLLLPHSMKDRILSYTLILVNQTRG